jgi:group I intron endonuclease
MFPKQAGVYCFKNTVNNKIYIGSAQCLHTRINNHLKNQSSNPHLQNAIKHYGINTFCITYQVLKTKEEALCLEQMLLDYIFKLNIDCYNISISATDGKVLADYSNHGLSCEKGGGCKAKITYGLEVNNPEQIQFFKSKYEAAKITKVFQGEVHKSCKNIKPTNGQGRWLFSDVSIEDLQTKFNIAASNLCRCLKGKSKSIGGYTAQYV